VKPGRLDQPIRVAISGGSVSPGIFESLATLGKNRSVERIERALERLDSGPKQG
jgi:glutamyl-tRNA synthetase